MKKKLSTHGGFSTIQLLITIAVMSIITGMAVIGISRSRSNLRLQNSAREFAAYVERARADAVRRHGGSIVQVLDNDSYSVTMDFDYDGTITTQNFTLQEGVTFTTGEKSVTFDWRGRIPQEESFGFSNGRNTVSVGVTGSGDVTFDAQFFHDASLPPVAINGQGGTVLPDPSPGPGSGGPSPSPSPSPSPGSSPSQSPNPSPTPSATATATPQATATPTPSPTAQPSVSPSPQPTPTATPAPCSLSANPSSLSIVSNGSTNVNVSRANATGSGVITATSSNSGQIQVSPTSKTVSGTAAATFQVTVKRVSGSVTFSSSGCTSKTVPVTIR